MRVAIGGGEASLSTSRMMPLGRRSPPHESRTTGYLSVVNPFLTHLSRRRSPSAPPSSVAVLVGKACDLLEPSFPKPCFGIHLREANSFPCPIPDTHPV